jgi:hypothetical protein
MAASANDIAVVRLGITVPEEKAEAFTDDLLRGFIEAHPVKDSKRLKPTDVGWVATYDLNAATADLWDLIAASLAALYDFSADGATFSRSQLMANARSMARSFRSRSHATSVPLERSRQADILYQGRWPYTAEFDLQAYQEAEESVYAPNTQQGIGL